MSENRVRRVAEQIRKDVSLIIGREIKDPRVAGLTSVTGVEVSRDLRYASVYVSVYGSAEEKAATMEVLSRAAGYIRSEIGRRIRLRHTPEITFLADESMEYGAHIEKVIKNIKGEKGMEDNGTSGDH